VKFLLNKKKVHLIVVMVLFWH